MTMGYNVVMSIRVACSNGCEVRLQLFTSNPPSRERISARPFAVESDKPLPLFMPVSEEWDTRTMAQSQGDRFIYLKKSNPLSIKPSLLNTLITPEPIDANFLRTFDCGCA
jgi:hypothetical protein